MARIESVYVLDRTVDDRREGGQQVDRRGVAEAVLGEEGGEVALLVVQGHVIEKHRINEQVDVVGRGARCGLYRAVGAEVADLLVARLIVRRRAPQYGAFYRIVDQEERGGGR